MMLSRRSRRAPYLGCVVLLNLRALLARKGLTAYRLAKTTGLSLTTIYRLTRPHGRFGRIEAVTIDKLCTALRCTPGDLFRYTPERPRKRGH